MADLVTHIDITGCTTYVGQAFSVPGLAASSTAWKILRIQEAVSGCTVYYADGAPTFTHRWTQRTSKGYTVG